MLQKVMVGMKEINAKKLSKKWEGPYQVIGIIRKVTYQLANKPVKNRKAIRISAT